MAALDNTAISRHRAPDLVPGYRLEKLVGKGGMGEVHKAVQLSLGRTVAVKLLAGELATDASFVARFEKEAAALATLSHPNVVSIVDKGKNEETYYLVMEFVDGPSLREVMRSPLLDSAGALRILMEICRAVDYAHGRGVVHRDLKPENILFDEQAGGIAKVSDFGLASFLDNAVSKYNVTETHVSMGTLAYMAPEQRVDAKSADHRADIYSLGMMLYEMLVGELPVGTFDLPSTRRPDLDKRLDAIVARCLKPVPADRYGKVSELITDLEPLVPSSFTAPPKKLKPLERARLRVNAFVRRTVRVASVILVVAALVVLGLAWARARNKPPARALTSTLLMGDLKMQRAMTLPGQVFTHDDRRRFLLGEGPETLPLVVAGRPVVVEGRALVFGPAREDPAGRVVLDAVDVTGVGATAEADLTSALPPSTAMTSLKAALLGTVEEPRAGLLLVGELGHYVALVLAGNGAPMQLEWALGERRGAMLGPASPRDGHARLRLKVDRAGELLAQWFVEGDWHTIGEPLHLGADWTRLFGKPPTPALGCLEGICRASEIAFEVAREPPAPPPLPLSLPPPPAASFAQEPRVAVHVREPLPSRPAVKKPTFTPTKKPALRPTVPLPVKKHRAGRKSYLSSEHGKS